MDAGANFDGENDYSEAVAREAEPEEVVSVDDEEDE